MENRFFQKSNEVNYASKFKDDSYDAPKILRQGTSAPSSGTVRPPVGPNYAAGPGFVPVQQGLPAGADNTAQLFYLQGEVARLREELNRQMQRAELHEEIEKLRAELTGAAPRRTMLTTEPESAPTPAPATEEPSRPVSAEEDAFRAPAVREPAAEGTEPAESADEVAEILLEKLEAVKTDLTEQMRAQSEDLREKLNAVPASAQPDSILDTNSIMQSTLLDEIMELKRALDENAVTKEDLSATVDAILEKLRAVLVEFDGQKAAADREREQFVTTQFSLLYEMLAYNFETNSTLVEESKETLEGRIQELSDNLGRNSSASAELVIKLTQIISMLGIELKKGQDVIGAVRDQLDAKFGESEAEIRREIEILSEKLEKLTKKAPAENGLDLLVSVGFEKLSELLGAEKARTVFTLKQWKDELYAEFDIYKIANFIKEKALLLRSYRLVVADVNALKRMVRYGVTSQLSKDLMDGILELPIDYLVDISALAEQFVVAAEPTDADRILQRIAALKTELRALEDNHVALFAGIADSIKEIARAVDGGARAEELERVNAHLERTMPEMLALLQSRIVEGVKANLLDKEETRRRLDALSADLEKLNDVSELKSSIADFRKEVGEALTERNEVAAAAAQEAIPEVGEAAEETSADEASAPAQTE